MASLGSLGSLYLDLRAGTAAFETDMGRAARIAEKESRRIAQQAARMGAAAGAAAATAAGVFSLLVKKQIDVADQMGKVAQSSGIAVEQLSRLDYAARAGGVNDLDRQIQALQKNLVLSVRGTGVQAQAFRAMGIETRDASGALKSADVLLLEVADAFEKHGDGTEKAAIAQALFGDGAAKMIPLLNGGSKAIKAAGDEAARLGLIVGADLSANAAEFNDNLSRMQRAADGVANRVANGLTPTLTDLSGQFVDWATDAETAERATRLVDASVKGLIVTGIAVKSAFQGIGTMIGGVLAAAKTVGDDLSITSFMHPAKLLWDLSKSAPAAAEILREAFGDARSSMSKDIEAIVAVMGAGNRAMGQLAQGAGTGVASGAGANKPRFDLIVPGADKPTGIDEAADRELQARLRAMEQMQQQARALAESLQTPDEKWQAQVARINQYYDAVDELGRPLLTADERTRALAAANDEYYQSLARLDDVGQETFAQLSTFADQAARNMQTSLADFFFNPFEDGLQGLADSFANTLQRMAAELLASEVFRLAGTLGGNSNPILGAIGSIAGAFLPGSSAASGNSLNLDYSFGDVSFGGGRAKGGDIQPNRWYMVGEEGPEPFYAGVSGTVVPFQKMGAGGGAAPIVQIHNYSGQPARTERGTGPNGEALVRVIVGEVSRSIAENGTVARTMASTFGLQRKAARG